MVSRLVLMLLVWGLWSFQGLLRLSARPVFDVSGISPERSGQNSEVDHGYHHIDSKSTAWEDGTCRTFSVQSTQSKRALVDSSYLRGRQLSDGSGKSRPGPNPAPDSGPPTAPNG